MSSTSRQLVLGVGLAGLIVEAVISHPALSVDKVKLFKVTTPKDQIVIGLTRDELDRLPGKNAEGMTKVLRDNGYLKVWQYAVRSGVSGEPEQAPVKPFFLTSNTAVLIEPLKTPMRIVPITDEKMAVAGPLPIKSSEAGTILR